MMDFGMPPSQAIAVSKAKNSTMSMSQYPSNLGAHAMNFSFVKYNRNKSKSESKIINTISLPIPQELNEVYGASYQDAELGLIGGEGLQAAMTIGDMADRIGEKGNLSSIVDEGGKIINNVRNMDISGTLQLAVRRALAGVSAELGGVVDLAKGNVPNPHAALLFNGINLRSHQFSWKFSPMNTKDETSLMVILKQFKRHMLPNKKGLGAGGQGDSLLTYPDEVDVSFFGSDSGLFKMKRSVITDLSINQSPEGPAFHAGTGNPVFYAVSMTLREVEIMTRDDFEDTPTGLGTVDYST